MIKVSQLIWRGIILFLFGTCFSFVLNMLQTRRHVVAAEMEDLLTKTLYARWWLSLICGSCSAFIGLVYPCLERRLEDHHLKSQEWSRVLRCIAMFIGINEAYTKIDFPSNLHMTLSLVVLSIGMWWYFDRTKIGFALGISIAALATLISQMLVYHEVCTYNEKEFLYIRSWLPCVVFSGGITVGNIGKQLALNDFADNEDKAHTE